jgi:hypothetical protein
VQVLNSDGSVSSTAVQVGLVTTSMAQITSGLNSGETVVVGTTTSRTGTTGTGSNSGINLGGLTGGGGGFGGGGRVVTP